MELFLKLSDHGIFRLAFIAKLLFLQGCDVLFEGIVFLPQPSDFDVQVVQFSLLFANGSSDFWGKFTGFGILARITGLSVAMLMSSLPIEEAWTRHFSHPG